MSAKKFLTLLRKPLAVVLAVAAVVSGVQLASLSPQVQISESGIMTVAYSDPGQYVGPTGNVLERTADPITMMGYLDAFGQNDDSGSRYMGRVWTDKSVMAYGEAQSAGGAVFDGQTLTVNGKTVTLNDDFLNVFSATASSEKVNTYPPAPIDLVIALDLSGSMGDDVEPDCSGTHPEGEKETRIQHSRIYKTITAVNETIDELMELNPYNRVGVVGYGATSVVLMPLGHYKTDSEDGSATDEHLNYLTVSGFVSYGTSDYDQTGSCSYEVTVTGERTDRFDNTGYVALPAASFVNDYSAVIKYADFKNGNEKAIGYNTNMQAGIYSAFELLYDGATADTAKFSYTFGHNGRTVNVARVPAVFVMTDGGSNYAVKADTNAEATGDEWHDVPVDIGDVDFYDSNRFHNVYFKKYRCENDWYDWAKSEADSAKHPDAKYSGDGVILDILMTASYMKTKVENKYTKLLQDGGVYDYTENMDMYVYTISIDTPNVQWQTPRVYSTMDPKNFFNANPKAVNGIDPNSWIQKQDVIDAYNTFIDWTEAETEDGVTITFPSSVASKGSDGEPIDDITLKFKRLPEDGEDLGYGIKVTNEQVAENILYNDAFLDIDAVDVSSAFDQMLETIKGRAFTPVGGSNDFGAINAITYADPIGLYLEIKDGSIIGTADAPKSENLGGEQPYDMMLSLFGEMHGVVKTAMYNYNFEHGDTWDGIGWYNSDGEKVEDVGSFANGDMYYLDETTALEFLPTLSTIDTKAQNTTYTFYRLAETDRTATLENPAYTETEDITYSLSDIRIWVEDTGNYNDDSYGSIMPESGYNQLLCFSVPAGAVPAYLTEVTEGPEQVTVYHTNEDDTTAWEPIRLYYVTGIQDEAMTDDNLDVDITKLHQEYVSTHRTDDETGIYFRDSHWSGSTYSGYQVYTGDVSIGDAVVSLSPAADNRYYHFQRPLEIYTNIYQYHVVGGERKLDPVDFKNAAWDGVEITGVFSDSETAMNSVDEGDYVVLRSDRINKREDAKYDNEWLIIVGDYYRAARDEDGNKLESGHYVSRAVARLGSEFETETGQPLCWFNSITNKTQPFDHWDDDVEADANWYIATAAEGFRMGDLAQMAGAKSENKTGTSTTFYVPTVNGGTINVYLGNNGRIKIENTKLVVTKLVYDEIDTLDLDDETEFSYDIFIDGHEGDFSALKLAYHDPDGEDGLRAAHWDYLVDSVAVFTNENGFLLDSDGVSKAVVDGHTFKVKDGLGPEDGWYQDELRMVVAGYESRDADDTGLDGAHFFPTEDQIDVYDAAGESPVEEDVSMPIVWATVIDPSASGNDAGYGGSNRYADDFKSEATWLTETINFSEDGVATGIKLKSGEGLLFAGIKSGSEYTVSESLTYEQLLAGYSLGSVEHDQQESHVTYDKDGNAIEGEGRTFEKQDTDTPYRYTISGDTGGQVECVHWNNRFTFEPDDEPHKTEVTPGDGETVQIGDEITYRISYMNGTKDPAKIVIRDPLDVGNTFVSATDGGVYDAVTHTVMWTLEDVGALNSGYVELTVCVNEEADVLHKVDNTAYVSVANAPEVQTEIVHNPEGEPHKTETTPGAGETVQPGDEITYEISYVNNTDETADITIRDPLDPGVTFVSASGTGYYDEPSHTVTWTIGEVPTLTGGKVTLTVVVNDDVTVKNEVENTAWVKVGSNLEQQTETIHNPSGGPHKTEVTPGDGETVKIGDVIVYHISWINNTDETATIVIRDPLDVGNTFVSADNGGVYDEYANTVRWTIPDVEPGVHGVVEVQVRVNDQAAIKHRVDNTAYVVVGNNPEQQTETVSNPEGEPEAHKTELTLGEGELVDVDDEITYEITYNNPTPEAMDVIIQDPLDPNVDFVSCDQGGVYDELTHTVTWTFRQVPPVTDGYFVKLTVRVNENAVERVYNQASVKFGDRPWVDTERPENPLKAYGGLSIEKLVTGSDGETDRRWNFTVVLGESLTGRYGEITFMNGVAHFYLKSDEKVEITGLPAGTTYRITEDDANIDGYYSSWIGESGVIPESGTAEAKFTNRRDTPVVGIGSLLVRKTVTGSGDTSREWEFTVTLDSDLTGTFGDMVFRDGVATFTLMHGQRARAYGLPEGTSYQVIETEANSGGYTTEKTGDTGEIRVGSTSVAEFVNDRPEEVPREAKLTVTKTVTGNGDKDKSWHFTVTVGQDISGSYGGYTFKNGVCELTLKHGEKAVITGLPYGAKYSVKESEANQGGYKTSSSGSSGKLGDDTRCEYTNHLEPAAPGTGDGGGGWPWLLLFLGCLGGLGGLFLIPVAPDKKQRRRTRHVTRK